MKRQFIAIALAAVMALVLGACGGKKDTGFNNLASPKATGTGAGVTEIKLAPGNVFNPVTFEAKVGAPVVWRNVDTQQPHNVEADDGSFNSSPGCTLEDQAKCLSSGSTYSFTFKAAGEYKYFCVIHGAKGGVGMAGTVKVT